VILNIPMSTSITVSIEDAAKNPTNGIVVRMRGGRVTYEVWGWTRTNYDLLVEVRRWDDGPEPRRFTIDGDAWADLVMHGASSATRPLCG
jgi:hypothetical protein